MDQVFKVPLAYFNLTILLLYVDRSFAYSFLNLLVDQVAHHSIYLLNKLVVCVEVQLTVSQLDVKLRLLAILDLLDGSLVPIAHSFQLRIFIDEALNLGSKVLIVRFKSAKLLLKDIFLYLFYAFLYCILGFLQLLPSFFLSLLDVFYVFWDSLSHL